MVARQLKNTRLRVTDGTLYAVYMPKLYKIANFSFLTFYIDKYIINVDSERHNIKWFILRLWCEQGFDYAISLILQEMFSLKMSCTNSVLYL